MKGLTLIEILIGLFIISLLLALSIPVGVNLIETEQLGVASSEVMQTLRRAQIMAVSQENDSAYGVYFTSSGYVLFKGDSYVGREPSYDQIYSLPVGVSASGIGEIWFNKLDGIPNVTGTIILSNSRDFDTVEINGIGRVALVAACYGINDCPSLAGSQCTNRAGCSFGWACKDNPFCVLCGNFNGTDETICENQVGCKWDKKNNLCTGTCKPCSQRIQAECVDTIYGCSWELICSGTPNQTCESMDETECDALNDGCNWRF